MSLISKDVIEGKIKEATINDKENEKSDFRYRILNEKSQLIVQKYIQSPLDKTIEYVDGSNQMQKKDIHLDNSQFFLRLPINPEMYFIAFDMHEKQLLLIKLKE